MQNCDIFNKIRFQKAIYDLIILSFYDNGKEISATVF